MIVLGSESALNSEAVEEELDIFLSTSRTIIPVDIDGLENARWYPKIEGIAVFYEKRDNAILGQPSSELLERCEGSLQYTKQSKRLRISSIAALTIILVAVVVSIILGDLISDQGKELESNEKALSISRNDLKQTNDLLQTNRNQLTIIEAQKQEAECKAAEAEQWAEEQTRIALSNFHLAQAGIVMANNGYFGDTQFDYYALMRSGLLTLSSFKNNRSSEARGKLQEIISQIGGIIFSKKFEGNIVQAKYDFFSNKIALLEEKDPYYRIKLYDIKNGNYDYQTEFKFKNVGDMVLNSRNVWIAHNTDKCSRVTSLFTLPGRDTIYENTCYNAPANYKVEQLRRLDSKVACVLRKSNIAFENPDDGKLVVIQQNEHGKCNHINTDIGKIDYGFPIRSYAFNRDNNMFVSYNERCLRVFDITQNGIMKRDSLILEKKIRHLMGIDRDHILLIPEDYSSIDINVYSYLSESPSYSFGSSSLMWQAHFDMGHIYYSTNGIREYQMVGKLNTYPNFQDKDRLTGRILVKGQILDIDQEYQRVTVLGVDGNVMIADMSKLENEYLDKLSDENLIRLANTRLIDIFSESEKQKLLLD